MSPVASAVIERLDSARQKWWLFTLLGHTVLAMCVSFGLLLVFMLADALLRCSQPALLVLFLSWLAVTTALTVVVTRRLMRSERSLEATARRVESEYPELGSNLINLVQLDQDDGAAGRAFRVAAVGEAAARIGRVRFEAAADKQSRRRRFLDCMQTPRDLFELLGFLVLLLAVTMPCHWLIPNWASAATRLLMPWQFVPSVGTVEIVDVTPGNTDVMLGSSLRIVAVINNPDKTPHQGVLFVTVDGEGRTALPMAADAARRRYTFTLPTVLRPLKYRLEIGDSQSEIYSVGVREKPTVEEIRVTLHYPPYLDRGDESFVQKHGDLEAPQYTVAELHIRPSVGVARGYIQSDGERHHGRVEDGGRLLIVEKMPLLKDTTYTVHLFNDVGHTDTEPRINRVHVIPDRPPGVELLKPPRESSAAAGSTVGVTIRARDDHGLGSLKLEMKIDRSGRETEAPGESAARPSGDATPMVIGQWNDVDGNTSAMRRHRLQLDSERVRPGRAVLLRAVAADRRAVSGWGLKLGAQETTTPWRVIRVVAEQEAATAALEQLDGLRAGVWRILEMQIRARVLAATILKGEQPEHRIGTAADVRTRQIAIQQAATGLVKAIGQTDREERLTVKRVLNNLALGDMLQAVRQCDELAKLRSEESWLAPVSELGGTQDRIIDVLRRLLDAVRQAQSDVLAEMADRPGGDLSDDVQKKLGELRDKLDEFLKRQKKVIEATENLAKTPVEDFTEEEEQLLKDLAAAEEEWSRFMKDFHSDLSKLPEQDFANPSLLKELIEIETELKMAEDALLKKTSDIAVPLEQLGAEMAEELLTNLEKWLPDTPDRERWSQEESLTDQDKEAPMAELPGELEDLVGELMEEEEDLFDEMEDVSSSAADSLDAGAGWDTLDGPISNMSAKGVTGNRLPNTSEIGGRSAEGRTGKSSGEFVGEDAVGKGGRKTPSRLTPDPYAKGQIKDSSKDPTGGATGGGKESGQGGEGLEGPVPPSPGERQLTRLAERQAELRNQAEGIDLQLQITNFHRSDLKKMIDLMKQVERDLRAGRYRNALRQRKVILGGLGNMKQYLDGEFEVRQDTTSNLPGDIQKKLLGSMRDPSPAGWEELNRQYFERLNTGGSPAEP